MYHHTETDMQCQLKEDCKMCNGECFMFFTVCSVRSQLHISNNFSRVSSRSDGCSLFCVEKCHLHVYSELNKISNFCNSEIFRTRAQNMNNLNQGLRFLLLCFICRWQSLVGAILLRVLIGMGKVNVELSQITR